MKDAHNSADERSSPSEHSQYDPEPGQPEGSAAVRSSPRQASQTVPSLQEEPMEADSSIDPERVDHQQEQRDCTATPHCRQPDQGWQTQQKQQLSRHHEASSAHAHFVHTFIADSITHPPLLEITCRQLPDPSFSSKQGSRQQQQMETLLLLQQPMQLVTGSSGSSNLVHWCSEELEPPEQSYDPGSRGSGCHFEATITVSLPKSGVFSRSKQHKTTWRMLPSCRHHFLLDASLLSSRKGSGSSAEARGVLMASAVHMLLQQMQGANHTNMIPPLLQQLSDLAQQCTLQPGSEPSADDMGSRQNAIGSSTSSTKHHGRKDASRTSADSNCAAVAAVLAAVTILGQQLPIAAGIAADRAAAAHNVALSAVTAWVAFLMLSKVGTAAGKQHARALSAEAQQQLQLSVAALLQAFAVLGDTAPQGSTTAASSHGRSSSSTGKQCPVKRARDDIDQSAQKAADNDNSSSASADAFEDGWLAVMQKAMAGSITSDGASCALALSNLDDLAWVEAVPALYKLMRNPSLGFLYGVGQQIHQHSTNYSSTAPSSGRRLDHFAFVTAQLYARLNRINRHITSDYGLSAAVIASAPGLPGLLHLLQLPELAQHRNQAYGAASQVSWRLTTAIDNAMRKASLHELLVCWGQWPEALQAGFRYKVQDAVVTALLRDGQTTGITAGTAAGHTSAAGSKGASRSDAMAAVVVELLYGSLFTDPKQLMQAFAHTSRNSKACWPGFVTYQLMPAALSLLVEQHASADSLMPQQDAVDKQGDRETNEVAADADAAAGTGTEQLPASEQQQHAFDTDVMQFVQQWLQHVNLSVEASSLWSADRAKCSDSDPLLYLFCAAEVLLRQCPPDTWGVADLQQLLQTGQGSGHALTPLSASPPCLLQYVLQLLAEKLQQSLQKGHFRTVLSLPGPLASFGCCKLLQKHYLEQLSVHTEAQHITDHTQLQQPQVVSAASPASLEQPGSVVNDHQATPSMSAAMRAQFCSSWEAADLLVSAVLGCQPGAQGIESLSSSLSSNHNSESISRNAAHDLDDGWHVAQGRQTRNKHAQAHLEPPGSVGNTQPGLAWLQEQTLLLLADLLLQPSALADTAADQQSVGPTTTADSASCRLPQVTLLQDQDDLLAGHPLWLKLLIAGNHTAGVAAPSNGSPSDAASLQQHPAVQRIALAANLLCSKVAAGSFTVGELQHLQHQQPVLVMLADALQQFQQSCPLAAAVVDSLTAAAAGLQRFQQQQRALGDFYTVLCPAVSGIADLDDYIADLGCISSALDSCLVKDLSCSSTLGRHADVLDAAQQVASVLHTIPFTNSVRLYQQAKHAQKDAKHDETESAGFVAAVIVDWSGPGIADPCIDSITVLEVCHMVPSLLEHLTSQWTAATTGSSASCSAGPSVADVLALWVSDMHNDDQVAAHYQQIQAFVDSQQVVNSSSSGDSAQQVVLSAVDVSALLRLYHSSREIPWAEQLAELQEVLQLSDSPLLRAVQQLPSTSLLQLQVPAVQLAAAFREIEQQLGVLSGHQDLFVQLGRSSGLQEFLAATGSDDLRRLADGAEDQGDGFLRSSVLSDLLEVNRMMQQLRPLQASATLEQLLQTLVEIATANARRVKAHSTRTAAAVAQVPAKTSAASLVDSDITQEDISAACSRLTAQLKSCIEYLHGFKALYNRLANRAELTREVVASIMHRGVYCLSTKTSAAGTDIGPAAVIQQASAGSAPSSNVTAYCSCSESNDSAGTPAAAARRWGVSQLQELCSRVMLLASSSNLGAKGETSAPDGSTAAADTLSLFVQEVSVVTDIAAALLQLLDLGCFSYRAWERQLGATEEPQQRLPQLKGLLQELQQDLQDWQHELTVAQAKCGWLNYFEPRQLISLVKLLFKGHVTGSRQGMSPITAEERQNAVALLRFAQADLRQGHVNAVEALLPSIIAMASLARRPKTTGSPAIVSATKQLYELAVALDILYGAAPSAQATSALGEQQAVAHEAAPCCSSIKVVIKDSAASSIGVLLQAHSAAGSDALQPSDVVFCNSNTSLWQIQLLLQRCCPALAWHMATTSKSSCSTVVEDCCSVEATRGAAGSGSCTGQQQHKAGLRLYVLCDVEQLQYEQQSKLLQLVKLLGNQHISGSCTGFQLLLICSSNCLMVNSLQQIVSLGQQEADATACALAIEQLEYASDTAAAAVCMHRLLQEQGCSVVVLTSDLPGQGKSTAAAKVATAQGKQPYHVLLVDDMQPPCDLISQLRQWDPAAQLLHIQLLNCNNTNMVEQLLFSLLVLGHLSDGSSVYHRSQEACHIVIEVGNSLGEGMLQQMPLLAAAAQHNGTQLQQLGSGAAAVELAAGCGELLQPGYRRLHCTFNPAHTDVASGDMQLLCAYLALAEAGVLDRATVGADGLIQQQYQQYRPTDVNSRRLLLQSFVAGKEAVMSYTLLHTFVSVAARQLRYMSGSCFFEPSTLQYAFGGAQCAVRSQLLQAIIAAANSFATESCSAVRNRQHQNQQTTPNTADAGLQLASRMASVIGWSDSNHLLLLFNAADGHQSITPVYRRRDHVPASFQQLLAIQVLRSESGRTGLVDYTALSHDQLQQVLQQLVQPPGRENGSDNRVPSYILTADNLLKMSLVYLKAQCGLPVVMMGDTGCGKTSLLKYLAAAAGVELQVLNVHAGTSSADILQAVQEAETTATATDAHQVWLFFDECNTCEHQGLLTSIISHRQLPGGKNLHPNIIPIAAVNPYRLKPASCQSGASGASIAATAGLKGKLPASHTGLGRLVYSVQPSPEALLDHVCDYGTLSSSDEASYIRAMVAQAATDGTITLPDELLVDLLCISQRHIRQCGFAWDVSLRDVNRCLRLARWFEGNMRNRPKPKRKHNPSQWLQAAGRYLWRTEEQQQLEALQREQASLQLQALVLALMHTYQSRLSKCADRQQYLQLLVGTFREHGKTSSQKELTDILRAEQEDYLKRMELPPGIALNEAVRENVFTALVSILNKTPLFLVGKPGSSKSLALRLIHANLRGPDSSDDFFRQLPALLFYSYQGSESSTSEGIQKVFAEAKKAAEAAGASTIVVVLLDEVGLAEISPHNPLKALHALLEPGYPAQHPDVAVVGISNWALDAAKMSRAVLLSRPEPELQDLISTAITIWEATHNSPADAAKQHTLKEVATAYHHLYREQSIRDYFGLRDFYALISTLSLQPQLSPGQLYKAVLRNFGGPAELVQQVINTFSKYVVQPPNNRLPAVDSLIRENLMDHTARHLLVISSGNLAVDVVHSCLATPDSTWQQNTACSRAAVMVLWGSPWPDDQSEVYKYRMLNEIILRMEQGDTLVLRDCGIFGALYDMLNQNYSIVGGRKNCRIALGPHSNPMCTVHDNFKVVVVMDPAQAAAADPSLLNRFEKQWLDCRQLLPVSYQKLLLESLEQWVQQLGGAAAGCTTAGSPAASGTVHSSAWGSTAASAHFGIEDLLLGYYKDSLPGMLVRYRNSIGRQQRDMLADQQVRRQLAEQCQRLLMAVCSLDGLARACAASDSRLGTMLQQLVDCYLQAPTRGIADYVSHQLLQQPVLQQQQQQVEVAHEPVVAAANSTAPSSSDGRMTSIAAPDVALWYVMTRSAGHVTVAPLLQHIAEVLELFCSQIKSERELKQRLQDFLASASGQRATTAAAQCRTPAGRGQGSQGAQLLVFHATAEDAAELRHFRHLVADCVTAAGLKTGTSRSSISERAGMPSVGAARHATAPAVDKMDTMLEASDNSSSSADAAPAAPLIAIMVVVHLPIAEAAAHAAARVPVSNIAGSSKAASTSSANTAVTPGDTLQLEDSWQCSWLSDWQQVTVDSLEGYKSWVWKVIEQCLKSTAVAAGNQGLKDAAAGVAGVAAVDAVPLQQIMQGVLVPALSDLGYPDSPAAAARIKHIAEQLARSVGAGLLAVLQQMIHRQLQQWSGWQTQLLQLAGNTLQLQLHGSFPAAVEAAVVNEVRVQLSRFLLGLEQHQVLDAYWTAKEEVRQVVHKLLSEGRFTASNQQSSACRVLPEPLRLQLPFSGLCHSRLQAMRSDCEQLLDSKQSAAVEQPVVPTDGTHGKQDSLDTEMPDVEPVHDQSDSAAVHMQSVGHHTAQSYQLDTLLCAAVGEEMAELLKQHVVAFSCDLLLLTLAEAAGTSSSSSSWQLTQKAAQQFLQLLCSSTGSHAVQHPLQWQLLMWQHQPELQAIAEVLAHCKEACFQSSSTAEALSAGNSSSGSSSSVVDTLISSLYQSQLPTAANISAAGGATAWCSSCELMLLQAAVLRPLAPTSSSLALLNNLEVLLRLAKVASTCETEPTAAAQLVADDDHDLVQALNLVAELVADGSCIISNADLLATVLDVIRQLAANAVGVNGEAGSKPVISFTAWLLSQSIQAMPADVTHVSAESSFDPSPLLQLIVQQLLGGDCSAALLHPLIQLLQPFQYKQRGWQLLEDLQLLGQHSSICPVIQCVQTALTDTNVEHDSAAMALLTLALEQCCFDGSSLLECNQDTSVPAVLDQQVAAKVSAWVEKAATSLCSDSILLTQLAAVVAFLRAITAAAAPAATALVAISAPPSIGQTGKQQVLAAAKSWAPVLTTLDTVLVNASSHTRLQSLFVYMLKCLKGPQSMGHLQQLMSSIAKQPNHPLANSMAALLARLGATSQQQRLQQQLPLDPYKGLPQYEQLTQLLLEAAAWPESAAGLVRSKLQEAGPSTDSTRALLAVLSRQVYLARACINQQGAGIPPGLDQVAQQLPVLLQGLPLGWHVQQLLLALVQGGRGASSSSASSSNRGQLGGLLALTTTATQEQLYISSVMLHLAIMLSTTVSGDAAASGAPSPAEAAGRSAGLAGPLLLYLTIPVAAKGQYMLGMPSDEVAQLLNVKGLDGTSVYTCACGLPYLIGNCGKPSESRKCPTLGCPHKLGGQSHTPADGQQRLGSAGHLPERQQVGFINTLVASNFSSNPAAGSSSAFAAAASSGVRDLQPSSCQLLRLLVHAALAVGAATGLQPAGSLRSLVGRADDAAAQALVEQIVVQQWQLLKRSLQSTDEQVLAVAQSAISTLTTANAEFTSSCTWDLQNTANRHEWERVFHQHVAQQWTHSPTATLQQMLAARAPARGTDGGDAASSLYLSSAVQEGLVVSTDAGSSEQSSKPLLTLFRSIAVPSLDGLAAVFWADSANAARYPVTRAVLQEQQQQRLSLLPHLLQLVEFESSIRQSLSHTIDRATARSVTLQNHFRHTPFKLAGDRPPMSLAEAVASQGPLQLLEQFVESWNAVRSITSRLECQDVVVPELSVAEAPVGCACLTDRDEGRLLLAMLTELVTRHNRFLELVTPQPEDQEQQGDSTTHLTGTAQGNHPATGQQQQQLQTKPLQSMKQGDVIDVPAAVHALQQLLASPGAGGLACSGLAYGTGQTVTFCFEAIEHHLHQALVAGRTLLDVSAESLLKFVFKGELFQRSATLLHQVNSKIPQQQQTIAEAAALAVALQQQLPAGITAAAVLPHLELLLSFMVKTGGSGSSTVADYAAAWLPEGATRQLLTSCHFMQQVQLQQVVGLYEGLEDLVAAAVAIEDSCSLVYKRPMGAGLKQQVLRMVGRLQATSSTVGHGRPDGGRGHKSKAQPMNVLHQGKEQAGVAIIPPAVATVVLRRIMLRFLCGLHSSDGVQNDQAAQVDVPLSIYCCNFECCRWPCLDMGCADRQVAEQLIEQLFPEDLMVGHVASVVQLLK